ncbi:ATP-dependent sacrificial sulfur transferase LarE [Gemmata sp. JC717]|nr:ATP-dependent sacrificial sulfur transferase LarE [Gemmata algarum]MDY3555821.1 ATP-dependent sacrificial sulfur transferase LarE [Gemmata algarum]
MMGTEAHAIELSAELDAKREALLATLGAMPGVAVAFSGGIDSTVVAKAAHLALGARAVAVTADSPSVARTELRDARELAKLIGIRHVVVRTDEFRNPDYTKNDGSRCYHCKTELYTTVESLLPELEVSLIASGANLDDLGDYRPGLLAAAEHSVRHPLQEAGFTKADVRALAQFWGLPTWDKPAAPCLSSRMAPGVAVTPERTRRVEEAEAVLRSLGLRECRVRYHEGDLARVEVPVSELPTFAADPVRGELARALHGLGFKFVTIDLDGFRSGNLNELVPIELKLRYRRDEPTQAPAADEL